MVTINVLLSGRLKLDGYGEGFPSNGDGFVRLNLDNGATVREVITGLGVPHERVAMIMVNARLRPVETRLQVGDRIILIPPDVAALWRFLGVHNLGIESVFDF